MKQVTTNVFCDGHLARNASDEVSAQTIALAVNDEVPVSLDLCPACMVEYVEPLRKLMATFGEPIRLSTPKKRTRKASAPAGAAPAASGPAKKAASPTAKKGSKNEPTAAEVRAWAVQNDVPVPSTGRVPRSAYEAYAEAKGKARAKA